MNPSSSLDKLFRIVRVFFSITSAMALSLYVYLGSFVRPIGDDYCISARLIGYDPLTASLYKYWHTSNRFSNQFVAYLSDLFGPRGVAFLSMAMILLWVLGLTWLLYEAAQIFHVHWKIWTGFLLAELVVLISFYTASNLFQSVFWRPGVMTYFTPLVLFTLILAGIVRGSRLAAGGRASLWAIAILFFAAFFTGGLSETAGALHISILGLALASTWLWTKSTSRRAALALITAALAGALLAMFGMFITPANAIRLDDTVTPTLTVVILRALGFAAQFLSEAARLLKIPLAFVLISGSLIGFIFVKVGGIKSTSPRILWIGLILLPVLAYLLTVATFAPSAYGQSYPIERVRFPTHALLVITLLLEGGLFGLIVAHWNLPRWTTTLSLLALAILALYPLWATRNNLALIPEYQTRAERWDARDAKIRELAAAGEREIVVWQLSGIAQVKDLDTRPSHWINFCAAIYYGVDTISAPQGQVPSP